MHCLLINSAKVTDVSKFTKPNIIFFSCARIFCQPFLQVHKCLFNPTNPMKFATCSNDKTAKIWNVQDSRVEEGLLQGHKGRVRKSLNKEIFQHLMAGLLPLCVAMNVWVLFFFLSWQIFSVTLVSLGRLHTIATRTFCAKCTKLFLFLSLSFLFWTYFTIFVSKPKKKTQKRNTCFHQAKLDATVVADPFCLFAFCLLSTSLCFPQLNWPLFILAYIIVVIVNPNSLSATR
jgi:hypothetical protein